MGTGQEAYDKIRAGASLVQVLFMIKRELDVGTRMTPMPSLHGEIEARSATRRKMVVLDVLKFSCGFDDYNTLLWPCIPSLSFRIGLYFVNALFCFATRARVTGGPTTSLSTMRPCIQGPGSIYACKPQQHSMLLSCTRSSFSSRGKPVSRDQVYSLLVYKGPGAVPGIKAELADLLKTDGFTSVVEAVGSDHRPPRKASRK